jgi:ribosomal protein S18 acetylase RimI-like enzyme
MAVEIRRLRPGDDGAVAAAGALFDGAPKPDATRRFLEDPTHHLLIAYTDGDGAVGFVSGAEVTHPDKGTEMFLYELGVAETARRRGIGRALVQALGSIARERGCYGMWVLADDDNEPARATYGSAGGSEAARPIMIDWSFGGDAAQRDA